MADTSNYRAADDQTEAPTRLTTLQNTTGCSQRPQRSRLPKGRWPFQVQIKSHKRCGKGPISFAARIQHDAQAGKVGDYM